MRHMPADKVMATLHSLFMRLFRISILDEALAQHLMSQLGWTAESCLLITSFCRDEINDRIAKLFRERWGENFRLGGLGGLASGGLSAFEAAAHHVPDDGQILLIYGPHIGINNSGELGKLQRSGMSKETSACGAFASASDAIRGTNDLEWLAYADPTGLDPEYTRMLRTLGERHADEIRESEGVLLTTQLALALIRKQILAIVSASRYTGTVALVGGIIINTARKDDYFDLAQAEVFKLHNGEVIESDSIVEQLTS